MNLSILISVAALGNPLFQGLAGGVQPDNEISRAYVTPAAIVALPTTESAGVSNADLLIKPVDGQLIVESKGMCELSTKEGKQASILLDFGKELCGGIKIAAGARSGKQPVQVRVRFGESVSEACSDTGGDTPMSSATNDHAMRDFTLQIPWLGTVEAGNSGFRFVRIDLVDKDVSLLLRSVQAVFRYRDVPWLGTFECDDKRLNDIFSTAAYTVHLNMQEFLWDGIKRDRLVWLGDMHPEVMTIMSVFGDNRVIHKSLDKGRDTTPLPGWMNGISAYSMWWTLIQRDLYLYRGDLDYLRQQKDYLNGLMKLFISNIDGNKENIRGGRRFLDWPTSEKPAVIHAGYQALLTMTMEAGAQIAGWLSDGELKAACLDAARRLKSYVPEHLGVKQSASLLALAGLIDPAEGAKVVSKGGPDGFSTFYGYYMLESLAKAGQYDAALDIISQYWGAMLDLGATTFWEDLTYSDVANAGRIDTFVPPGKFDIHADGGAYCYKGLRLSLCHGWASGPAPWLMQHVLGVTPLEPGCKTVRIEPHLGRLTYAKGNFPTPHGVIEIEHRKGPDGKVISKIKAPKGVKVVR